MHKKISRLILFSYTFVVAFLQTNFFICSSVEAELISPPKNIKPAMKAAAPKVSPLPESNLSLEAQTTATKIKLGQCLAQEEAIIAKEATSISAPIIPLNRELGNYINESGDEIPFSSKAVNEICGSKKYTPSILLLRYILLQKNKLFLPLDPKDSLTPSLENSISQLSSEALMVFSTYISLLQQKAPTPDCLAKNITGLAELWQAIEQLQSEDGGSLDIVVTKLTPTIFDQIMDVEKIFAKCRKEEEDKKNQQQNSDTQENKPAVAPLASTSTTSLNLQQRPHSLLKSKSRTRSL